MNKVITNKFFLLAVGLIFVQQILIGASTYIIGQAGANIANRPMTAFHYVVIFFVLIFLAYLLGAVSLFFRVKLSNDLWQKYYQHTLGHIAARHYLSTEENKTKTNLWLSGEAISTLDEAGFASVEIIAVYFNVLFTVVALFFVLGAELAGVIFICMLLSVALLLLSKNKIHLLANSIQYKKLSALNAVSNIWDNVFFGDSAAAKSAFAASQHKVGKYFQRMEAYKILEQVISCLPILISIPILVFFSYQQVINDVAAIGSLVAVLPRTLQLFQNIHAASMSSGQVILLKNKIKNLAAFVDNLQGYDYEKNIDEQQISIIDLSSGETVPATSFKQWDFAATGMAGRFLITGSNGAGKSTLLKYMKSRYKEALYLGPNIEIGKRGIADSTGKKKLSQLAQLYGMSGKVIFLDEWDANLDVDNANQVDAALTQLAQHNVVIEVRHIHANDRG